MRNLVQMGAGSCNLLKGNMFKVVFENNHPAPYIVLVISIAKIESKVK